MKKTMMILILSVFITIWAAACGEQEIALEDVSMQAGTAAEESGSGSASSSKEATGASAGDAATVSGAGSGSVSATAAQQSVSGMYADESTASVTGVSDGAGRICVYVCGEVVTPGVYELAQGARIYEAVMLAGGLTEDADDTVINQAQAASDGMMIRIPAIGSAEAVAAQTTVTGQVSASDGTTLVDLNTADAAALMTLPGIGESKAAAIIAWRQENGRFQTAEDLKNVSGIGDSTYERLSSLITVTP